MGWFGSDSEQICRCGHGRIAHEHYRRGTECSAEACDCPRFRPSLFRTAMRRPVLPHTVTAVEPDDADRRAPAR
jgi:hypothetical protein